ncbi:MAG: VCBS repeat-containing protein [Acidobacteria bacterium]|nr:VCBS repeat-containing protein [Acidobacteriota bacterium]
MRSAWLWIGASAVSGLLALWVVTPGSSVGSREADGPREAEKQRIRSFWNSYHQANSLRLQGDPAGAAQLYRQCLDVDPHHEDSLYYLAVSLEEMGDYQPAAATLRKLIELNPSSGRALSELANVLSTPAPGAPAGFPEARRALECTVEVNREQAGPFLRLCLLDLNEGKFDAALVRFRTAAGFGSPEGNYWIGYTYYLLHRRPEALQFFHKVLDRYAQERKMAGQGIRAEGDVWPDATKPLTALERSALKATLFSRWIETSGPEVAGIKLEGGRAAPSFEVQRTGRPRARVLLIDLDGDGQAERVEAGAELRLYRREGDRWVERTAHSGLVSAGWVTDIVAADFNGDGRPDLFVLRWLKDAALYLNRGGGLFSDSTAQSGLQGIRGRSFSALSFDYDRDGRLDLLVSAHAPFDDVARSLLQPEFKPAAHTPRLFHNRGEGSFEDVTAAAGLTTCYGTMQALAADLDSDGYPDLLLVNGSPDALRLEPTVLLRNVEGREFRPWPQALGMDRPANRIGALVQAPGINLVPNPLLSRRAAR